MAELERAGAKLQVQVSERDAVISDNYATIQGLRRRVQELEAKLKVRCERAHPAI